MKYFPLHWQIFLSFLSAGLATLFFQNFPCDPRLLNNMLASCDLGGTLFLNALKMVIVPLVVSSVISGIIGMGSQENFRRIGLKTFFYYLGSTSLAILLGMILVNWIQPGNIAPDLAQKLLGNTQTTSLTELISTPKGDLKEILLGLVPSNLFAAATVNHQLLGLILFSILFGLMVSRLPLDLQKFQENLWKSLQFIFLQITNCIIKLAPIGVFCLLFPVFYRTGWDCFLPLMWLLTTVFLGYCIHTLFTLGLMLKWLGKLNPWQHLKAMSSTLFMAFSTSSTSATLPSMMQAVQDVGISQRTASFTLPLGSAINMNGTALYECVSVLFLGQLYSAATGTSWSWLYQLQVMGLSLLVSIGVVGIPAAGLIAMTIILGAVGIPLEAISIIWIIERILDMGRTVVNVYGDTCGAVIIGSSEGEPVCYRYH